MSTVHHVCTHRQDIAILLTIHLNCDHRLLQLLNFPSGLGRHTPIRCSAQHWISPSLHLLNWIQAWQLH